MRIDKYLTVSYTHLDVYKRQDLEGSRPDLMRARLQKLCGAVTSDAQVLPGHDRFSTMDAEKAENPYLRF